MMKGLGDIKKQEFPDRSGSKIPKDDQMSEQFEYLLNPIFGENLPMYG
jgi:hypothetical protein